MAGKAQRRSAAGGVIYVGDPFDVEMTPARRASLARQIVEALKVEPKPERN